ncbi:membrane protein [Rhodobacter capsulatus YW1]|nr:membrane protein [Rhodobacter capsulatus YW1]
MEKTAGGPMDAKLRILSERLLRKSFEELSERDRRVLRHVAEHGTVARDLSQPESDLGARIADRVAAFGGSWAFIGIFALVLLGWVALNTVVLVAAIDPYPFVFLNLILSMLAAVQAPVIMMSQNRQAEKDRLAAAHDYEVNLKAEIEIMRLHEKLDELRMVALEGRFAALEARLDAIAAAVGADQGATGGAT